MLPRSLINELFTPDLTNEIGDLNDSTFTETPAPNLVETIQEFSKPEPSAEFTPLTREESEAVDRMVEQTRERIAVQLKRLASVRAEIDSQVSSSKERTEFVLSAKKQPSLKRAIRKVFGSNENKVTYEMYVEALNAKRLMEEEDTREYTNGPLK